MSDSADQVIEDLRASLARQKEDRFGRHIELLGKTVTGKLWAYRTDASGCTFSGFCDFALYPPPHGLGVRSEQTVDRIKHAPKSLGHLEEWVELLGRIVMEPGRPRKNGTNDANFQFYSLPRSPHGQDRTMLKLKRDRPDLFARVAAAQLTAHQAAIQAVGRLDCSDTFFRGRSIETYSDDREVAVILILYGSLGSEGRRRVLHELSARPP